MSKSNLKIKLGQIGKVSMCKRIMKHQTSLNGDVPFYKISSFGDQTDTYISKEIYNEFKEKYSFPKKGDVLISAAGTLGKTAIYDGEPAYFQDSNIVWIDNDESIVLNSYLYYFYQTKPWVTTSGSTINRIYNDNLRNLNLSIPPLPTQRSIAKVLSDLDAKIELNNKINEELEAMAKTLYDYWFVQFDFPTPPSSTSGIVGKPYKSSGGKMVYNAELKREIPEGWEVKELGDCIKIFDHKRIPLSSKERETYKGIIPYYGATGILDYVNDFIFNDDLILLAEDGSVMDENGFPIVQFIWGKTWVNNHAHVIQANKKTQNEFYFQLLKRIPVILIKTGSIQMKINQKNLCNYKILTPSEDLIDKFSEVSRTIRKSLINITEQNQQLSSLRDWLLPMLMNGQVASRASATAE